MENPGLSSVAENTSQKMFIGTGKTSEIVTDLDWNGGSFSELSDSDTCKVNSPFSSSSSSISSIEKEVAWPEPTQEGKEHAGPFPNAAIQILS